MEKSAITTFSKVEFDAINGDIKSSLMKVSSYKKGIRKKTDPKKISAHQNFGVSVHILTFFQVLTSIFKSFRQNVRFRWIYVFSQK